MSYSYVYFITDDHGHIKIGKADDVSERLLELQTGNPFRLRVLLSVILASKRDAFSLESELHKMFEDYRLEGEWFEAEPILEMIDTDIVDTGSFKFGGLRYGK